MTLFVSEIHPKATGQLTVNDTGCICEQPCFRFLGRLGGLDPVRRKSNPDTLIQTGNLHPAIVFTSIDGIWHDKPNLEPFVRLFSFAHANLQECETSLAPASRVKLSRVKSHQCQFVDAAAQRFIELTRRDWRIGE